MKNRSIKGYGWKFLLTPLAWPWAVIYWVRRLCYHIGIFPSYSVDIPVVSVGNLTFGGTGKTPLVRWLSHFYNELGPKVLILSRGYKGELESSWGLIKSQNRLGYNPRKYGDEAVLLAQRLSAGHVLVGKERAKNLRYFLPRLKPDVVVLDDGHQHLGIQRDLNLLLFDATFPLNQYFTPPLGRMREGWSGMKFADAIIIGNTHLCSDQQLEQLKQFLIDHMEAQVPIVGVKYMPSGIFNINLEKIMSYEEMLEQFKQRPVVCFSGLASPSSFFNSLRGLGAQVIYTKAFPDHHNYRKQDLVPLLQLAQEQGALLLTTEKDIVKLKKHFPDKNILFLGIELEFAWGKQDLVKLLMESVPQNFRRSQNDSDNE